MLQAGSERNRLDRQARLVVEEIARGAVLPLENPLAWVRQRRAAIDSLARFAPPPEPVADVSHPPGPVPMRVYRPLKEGTLPTFIYVHGGGGVAGSLDTHDSPLRAIANRSGWAVVSIGYRLAPEHPFPAALEDCIAGLRHVAAGSIPGLNRCCLAVGGDGIGGALATTSARVTGVGLRSQILLYPRTDMRPDADYLSYRSEDGLVIDRLSMIRENDAYLPDAMMPADSRASPILAADLAHLPPAHIVICENDPLRDEGEAYAERLREAGVSVTQTRYPGMIHGFLQMGAQIDAAQRLIDEVADVLRNA